MTAWLIGGRGDTGTQAFHTNAKGGQQDYNVHRETATCWRAVVELDGEWAKRVGTEWPDEAAAHAACERHAASGTF